ncbi:TetR/AcrR family transcriptional regulator [Rhizobium halophytocola]|uniref:TetR/AcrR family transcriptional repressor for divergent bdcA n=1 Tax=Rhizobium halophytocola TaxID=735519 RepID=A0ABS4DT38_9HYPH|nr:TetR/AcrR family transcriptional regulator [Rhizobium halophytocola]MBP1848862.1 TetR/AcrR family transcriptional repressor for divergent bdcA [Rhizobium halophytocola]
MSATEKSRPRGRPRRFDPDQAVAAAQQLFHARGYDALGVAEITAALGINPPSFYAAFGSKAGLYAKVLERYADTRAIPLRKILRPDRPVAECLAAVLEEAARRYAADTDATGCLVLENVRCDDAAARAAACVFHTAAQEMIRGYIAERHPEVADNVADFVCATMAGLSARARDGLGLDRLLATARLAGRSLAAELPA